MISITLAFLNVLITASSFQSEIIRTKCTASMAFPFVFVCFVSCVLWALFGILIHDAFIVVSSLSYLVIVIVLSDVI